jgi:putative peptidoglycan lipid II flippase
MSKRIHSMQRFTAILISGALTSKLLGFGREVLMAHVLGASLVADGFRGALAAVFIPLALLQNESVPAIMIPMHREALRQLKHPAASAR